MATLNEVPIAEIPEVAAFEEVNQRYKAFREGNVEFFKYLDTLTEEYNQKLEAATMATRAKGVSCGSFEFYQKATKYHPDALYQAVGHEKFLTLGGQTTTQTVYGVDKARIDANIANGGIPEELAKQVRTIEPRYHKPKKIELP